MEESKTIAGILKALHFAATKHQDQRRKNIEAWPYINHPIEVAKLLSDQGRVTDPVILQAAILHDTIEDTKTTAEELEEVFGSEVRCVVGEVTDDKEKEKEERKRLQVEHAPHLSASARQIKIADKIANVLAVTTVPPSDWSFERRKEYLDWTEKVVEGCRGCNAALESHYDNVLEKGHYFLNQEENLSLAKDKFRRNMA